MGVGSGRNRGNYQTLLKMEEPEKRFLLLVPRHSHYVQQKKQYNQTMKPPGELYYLVILFFLVMKVPAERPPKKCRESGIQVTVSVRFGSPAAEGGGGVLLYISHIGMFRPKGYGFGAVMV